MKIAIDKCFCEDKPFEALIEIAKREQWSLNTLARHEGCGTHCGWCVAYLRRALHTGQTCFSTLLPKEPLDLPDEA